MACMPTISRASFIIWNMYEMPRWGSPTSQPWQSPLSPRLSAMLGMPRHPILWKAPAQCTSLGTSLPPSRRFFGTAKSETPLMPGGAPSIRASVRWTMFSVRS